MQFLTMFCGITAVFLTINLLFSFLYIVSKTAGNGFYRWASHDDLDFWVIPSFPFFGLTHYVASKFYDRFNWFKARMMLTLFSFLLLTLDIIFFISFINLSEST
ncbi:hypothetical protein [Guptibacillus hwajinpoensis]|uniref:DUF1361 domain-containing protein n=1 Tax=Guptibacillus hwajinpoensis TaxID=208199 RepID=A0ABU0JZD6_9BACL|nr:hypothetical protein [Alkalihalobacillus hemicentroti]MDQ0482458.1 hypothetical protein [Alkalihalobacillus hemicentroti]